MYSYPMSWVAITLLSVLVVSVANIFQKVLMKGDKSDPYSYAVIFHFLLGVICLAFGFVYGADFSYANGNIYFLLLSSALWGLCTIFLFKALQLIGSSEVTIVSTVRVIVIIIASVLFLNETFDLYKLLGSILIIIATFLIVDWKQGFKLDRGFVYALIMTTFAGLAIVTDSVNVRHYDVIAYNTAVNFLSACIILAFAPRSLGNWRPFFQFSFLKTMVPLAILAATQGTLYLLALSYGGNTAQVGTIRQATVIVTVILAVMFLHERENLGRKIVAAFLVTVGVVLLS